MPTIKIKVSDKIYQKLMAMLRSFSKEEVEIVQEDSDFEQNQAYLQAELKEMDEGNAEFESEETVNERLNNVIRKHEGKV